MNKDIEASLKELRLKAPSLELKEKILSNAMSAWRGKGKRALTPMQFRIILALAASLILFIGIIAVLNLIEAKNTQLALYPYLEEDRISSENIKFLEEMGLGSEYGKAVAAISEARDVKPLSARMNEFNL